MLLKSLAKRPLACLYHFLSLSFIFCSFSFHHFSHRGVILVGWSGMSSLSTLVMMRLLSLSCVSIVWVSQTSGWVQELHSCSTLDLNKSSSSLLKLCFSSVAGARLKRIVLWSERLLSLESLQFRILAARLEVARETSMHELPTWDAKVTRI